MYKSVSVVICCYNSATRIEKTLQSIAQQILEEIACELLLIDNGSTDNTSETALQFWGRCGNPDINFRIVSEPTPGVINARKSGVINATSDILIFCDDDNRLQEHYIQNVLNLFNQYVTVGIIGGSGIADFESSESKPIWFDNFSHGYAVDNQGDTEGFVSGVYGAGMAIKRQLAQQIFSTPFFLSGRNHDKLTAGDDAEICFKTRLLGYDIVWSPRLLFTHFLPDNRLNWEYLKKLHQGFAYSNPVISLYEQALCTDTTYIPVFFWLKKTLYYWGIYLKYSFRYYRIYAKHKYSKEEILLFTWRNIAAAYLSLNFKTISIYKEIVSNKTQNVIN